MPNANRRTFLRGCLGSAAMLRCSGLLLAAPAKPPFATRGVVLVPEDLTLEDWPERAKRAGLSTSGIHHQNSPGAVVRWVKSNVGQRFLEQCRKLGLQVEYELHAMKELLPRSLFGKNPELFRMDEKGRRTPDANCCVHSERALEIIGENAVDIARTLRPATGRYFYWGDDGQPWCQCPKCRRLLPSEQALVIENRMCKALRRLDPKAQVAHLAYSNTLTPPKQIRPAEGIFLEYAPISRLAGQHEVSRKFVYQQVAKAEEALDAAFSPADRDNQEVLFNLPATKAWLRQLTLGLTLICHRR